MHQQQTQMGAMIASMPLSGCLLQPGSDGKRPCSECHVCWPPAVPFPALLSAAAGSRGCSCSTTSSRMQSVNTS